MSNWSPCDGFNNYADDRSFKMPVDPVLAKIRSCKHEWRHGAAGVHHCDKCGAVDYSEADEQSIIVA